MPSVGTLEDLNPAPLMALKRTLPRAQFESLLDSWIAGTTERLCSAGTAAIAKDRAALAAIAHDIATTSGSFGARGLGKLAEQLEAVAGSIDFLDARGLIDDMSLAWENVLVALSRQSVLSTLGGAWCEADGKAPQSSNRSKIVLCVDDLAELRLMLQGHLVGAGYTYLGAATGQECLALTARVYPRLILLDVQMPGLDGFETCRLLRENVQLEGTPIIFLTKNRSSEDVQRGVSVGGDDFIVKPYRHADLLRRVRYWSRHRRRQTYFMPKPWSSPTSQ